MVVSHPAIGRRWERIRSVFVCSSEWVAFFCLFLSPFLLACCCCCCHLYFAFILCLCPASWLLSFSLPLLLPPRQKQQLSLLSHPLSLSSLESNTLYHHLLYSVYNKSLPEAAATTKAFEWTFPLYFFVFLTCILRIWSSLFSLPFPPFFHHQRKDGAWMNEWRKLFLACCWLLWQQSHLLWHYWERERS